MNISDVGLNDYQKDIIDAFQAEYRKLISSPMEVIPYLDPEDELVLDRRVEEMKDV